MMMEILSMEMGVLPSVLWRRDGCVLKSIAFSPYARLIPNFVVMASVNFFLPGKCVMMGIMSMGMGAQNNAWWKKVFFVRAISPPSVVSVAT